MNDSEKVLCYATRQCRHSPRRGGRGGALRGTEQGKQRALPAAGASKLNAGDCCWDKASDACVVEWWWGALVISFPQFQTGGVQEAAAETSNSMNVFKIVSIFGACCGLVCARHRAKLLSLFESHFAPVQSMHPRPLSPCHVSLDRSSNANSHSLSRCRPLSVHVPQRL